MVVPSLFLLEFPSDCLVKERADGKPLAWIGITQRNRQKLKTEDKTQCPWSCRDSVRKRGISVQLSSLNFIDELLDIKFMQECERLLITFDSSAPFHLFADIRQDTNYQLRSGSVSMLSGSRIYHYASDRCLVGAEHMAMNGWGKDWSDEDLTIDIIGKIQSECLGIPCKNKKGKVGEPDIAIAKLAGNAQGLADLALFALPLVYVLDVPGLFQKPFDLDAFLAVYESCDSDVQVEFDLNKSQQELRQMRGAASFNRDSEQHDESAAVRTTLEDSDYFSGI